MEFLTVTIKTLSPLVLTAINNAAVMTETRDFISGTVLRGVVASRYIENMKLGKAAEQNQDFKKLFFGGLRFIDAYPVMAGRRACLLPFSLQKAKLAEKNADGSVRLLDILKDKPEAGFKSVNGFGVCEGERIIPVSVNKQVKLHMSRAGEKERLSGRSLEGSIYNYEAIEEGQVFQGIIAGDKETLELLRKGLDLADNSLDCYIGRSRFTEYGHCSMMFGDICPVPVENVKGTRILLRLETPLLPVMGNALSVEDVLTPFVAQLKNKIGTDDIVIEQVVAKAEKIANFVGIWGMKRAEQQALSAGSVFALCKNSGWSEADVKALTELLYEGQGARTTEGFGQLRIWNVKAPVLSAKFLQDTKRRVVSSEAARKIAGNILMQRAKNLIRLQAEADVKKLRGKVDEATHSFARLESLLGARNNLSGARLRFQNKLQEELRDKSVLDERLKGLSLNGKELKEILLGSAPLPYASLDLSKELPQDLAEDIGFAFPKADNDILYYEYWLWFFRHGRKFAIARKGEK